MAYRVRISPVAIADVQEIGAYIAEENPGAASRMAHLLLSRIEQLADFPEIGSSLGARINMKTDYRFLACGDYLVFYRIEGDFVSVYRVLNGVRDYLSILFAEELPDE